MLFSIYIRNRSGIADVAAASRVAKSPVVQPNMMQSAHNRSVGRHSIGSDELAGVRENVLR
jgi:hypothetical protein